MKNNYFYQDYLDCVHGKYPRATQFGTTAEQFRKKYALRVGERKVREGRLAGSELALRGSSQ